MTNFRFDRPSIDGPVDAYAGQQFVGRVLYPESREVALDLFGSMRMTDIMRLWEQFAAWQPRPFWVSWQYRNEDGAFELRWPWWESGVVYSGSAMSLKEMGRNMVAAVRAATPEDAVEAVRRSYDKPPEALVVRFVHSRPEDWTPFGERFSRAAWMKW